MTIRTTTRRGSPFLVIDILYTKQDGTHARYRKDAQVQTKAGAQAEERRLLANIAKYGDVHAPISTQPLTFRQAVDLFKRTHAVTSLKARTMLGYQHILDKRLIPRFSDRQLDTIGYSELSQLDAELIREGLSAGTRRNVLACLRSVLSTAKKQGKLARMPDLPPLPKTDKKVLRTLSQEQVEQLLSHASPQGQLVIALAAYAGLRAGEIRALRWKDVDLVKGILVVRTAICRGIEGTPKSGEQRVIPIADPLRKLLEATPRRHEHVAVTREGKLWGEGGMRQMLKRAARRAALGPWRFHDLRHAFVTYLLVKGVPTHIVQKLAGHGSLVMTQRYAHTTEEDLVRAVGTSWKRSGSDGESGGQ